MKQIFFGSLLLFISACAQETNLPPVYVYTPTGQYFVPECPQYDKLPKSYVLVVPTVQEADLFKYFPAKDCAAQIANRRKLELDAIGEIKPTSEMHERRARFEREQAAQFNEAETERRLRDIQERQEELDEKLKEKIK